MSCRHDTCSGGRASRTVDRVINRGTPPIRSDREKVKLGRCDQEAAQWFLTRGYAVAFVLRRGYGETGGDWAEGELGCGNPDFVHAGLETVVDMDAAVDYFTRLPEVKPADAIVVGQSAGGWELSPMRVRRILRSRHSW